MHLRSRYFIKKMLLFYSFVLVPIVFSFFFIYYINLSNSKAVLNEKAQAQLSVSKNNLETTLDVSGQIATLFSNNTELYITTTSFFAREQLDYSGINTYKFMSQMVRYPTLVSPHIHSVYLYLHNRFDRFLLSNGKLEKAESYPDNDWLAFWLSRPENERHILLEARKIPDTPISPETNVVTIYRPIMGGVIVTNISRPVFDSVLSGYLNYDGEQLFVTTENNQLLFSSGNISSLADDLPHTDVSGQELVSNDISYIANSQYSQQFGIRFWSLVPKDILYRGSDLLMLYTCLALLGSLFMTFVCAYISTRKNFFQIARVIDSFERAEQGLPLSDKKFPSNDEYGIILDNIVRTFVNQSYLKLQLSERKYKQQATELAALQFQINPHFLFNTLQTINLEIENECGRDAASGKMLQLLSQLLNYALESPTGFVTLRTEINNLKKYCEIQKFRYEKKFFFFLDCDENLYDCQVCRLLLQPLVENSLYHGVRPKNGTAFIRVKARKKGDRIEFRVTDNGVGMGKTELDNLRFNLHSDDESKSTNHIGLQNTNRRLTLTFGDESALHIASRKGLGTVVSFTIPIQ